MPWWISLVVVIFTLWQNSYFECYAYKGFLKKEKVIKEKSFSLISYNVNLAYKEFNTHKSAEQIAYYLNDINADFILLQEYNPLLYPELQQFLSAKYNYSSPYVLADRYKTVFSKYPICEYVQLNNGKKREQKVLDEDRRYLPICGMKILTDRGELHICNCHLQSNNLSPALRAFRQQKLSIRLFFKTSIQSLFDGMDKRYEQALILRQYLNWNKKPTLICGDLNDVSGSRTLRLLRGKEMKDAWWNKGKGKGTTLKILGICLRLDHILYNKSIEIDEIKNGESGLSDHRPIICKFHLLSNNRS